MTTFPQNVVFRFFGPKAPLQLASAAKQDLADIDLALSHYGDALWSTLGTHFFLTQGLDVVSQGRHTCTNGSHPCTSVRLP